MNKKVFFLSLIISTMACFISFAGTTYSEYWKQDAPGNWFVQRSDGTKVVNAWLCDDAVAANGKDIWYLLDANGQMISAGLVQDGTGNYYSIETEHNGYYGMLRNKSGNYGGIDLQLEGSHNGSFAAIKNADGIAALNAKYGLTSVANIDNSNCVYTSSFGKASAAGGSGSNSGASSTYVPAATGTSAGGADPRLKNMDKFFLIGDAQMDTAAFMERYNAGEYALYPYGMCHVPQEAYDIMADFLTSFDWINASDEEKVEHAYNRVAVNHNGYKYREKIAGTWDTLVNKEGNCQDYAQILSMLCRLMDMDAKPLFNGYNHWTTRIVVDGVPYSFDASAGDPFGNANSTLWVPVE